MRGWERNPDNYSSGITNSAFVIMSRTFAPPEARLQSLIARERQMPKVLAEARANLKNPPQIYTEIAIEQMPGNISFFENDVPLAFKAVTDPKLLADFHAANDAVIASLKDYEQWMQKDLLPRSHGDFRLGAATYAKKLLYEEMVDIPLDRLLADRLRRPARQPEDDSPRPRRTSIPTRRRSRFWRSWKRIIRRRTSCWTRFATRWADCATSSSDHKIVTIPSPVLPILEETPPFMRALTFASMDTPGPYETVAKEAFFNVTLPEKDWPHGARGRLHGRVQPRHDPQHRDSRGVSRPLRAVSVDAARRFAGCASCWAPIPTPKAGRTIASR